MLLSGFSTDNSLKQQNFYAKYNCKELICSSSPHAHCPPGNVLQYHTTWGWTGCVQAVMRAATNQCIYCSHFTPVVQESYIKSLFEFHVRYIDHMLWLPHASILTGDMLSSQTFAFSVLVSFGFCQLYTTVTPAAVTGFLNIYKPQISI